MIVHEGELRMGWGDCNGKRNEGRMIDMEGEERMGWWR
jgi:hypothetical protein